MFACFKNFVNHKDEVSPNGHKDIWPSSYMKYGVYIVCSNSQFDYRIPGRRKSNLYNCRVNLWRLINIFLVKEWRSEECCQWISPRAKVFQSGFSGYCFSETENLRKSRAKVFQSGFSLFFCFFLRPKIWHWTMQHTSSYILPYIQY